MTSLSSATSCSQSTQPEWPQDYPWLDAVVLLYRRCVLGSMVFWLWSGPGVLKPRTTARYC